MRKYNITLTKDTAHIVLYRLQKLQNRNGRLLLNHKYIGQQKVAGYFSKQLGRGNHYPIVIITNATQSIIYKNDCKMEIDNDPNMQLIRINWDSDRYPGFEYGAGMIIKYGTKMYITSGKIIFKKLRFSDGIRMLTTIS